MNEVFGVKTSSLALRESGLRGCEVGRRGGMLNSANDDGNSGGATDRDGQAEGFIHHGEHLKVGDDDKGDGWREWKSIWHELYS